MGAKLDFVREDVPNVRSLTFLSFICPTPLSLRYPANHPLRLHSFASPSSLWTAAFILCQVSPRSTFFLRAEIPVSPETLDDVATLPHVPRYYAYFTDFYGIPRRLPPAFSSLFLYFDYKRISFCFSVVYPLFSHFCLYFLYFLISLLLIYNFLSNHSIS